MATFFVQNHNFKYQKVVVEENYFVLLLVKRTHFFFEGKTKLFCEHKFIIM